MELKRIRLINDKTQKEVANAVGITQFTYSNYETGKTQPDFETIIKLANYFNTTTDNLLGHKVPYLLDKSTLSKRQQDLLEAIKTLSDENCKRVQDFITGIMIAEEEKQKIINLYRKGE